jgi:hypothetical protein
MDLAKIYEQFPWWRLILTIYSNNLTDPGKNSKLVLIHEFICHNILNLLLNYF